MEFFVAALCGALDQVEQALVPPSTKPSLADIHFLNPIQNGTWEDEVPEAEFIHWAVRAGDNVLEIGANIGRSSIVAASCSQPGGSVVSSEADPERLLLAKANAANAENVRFVPAISASDLYLPLSSLRGGIAASTSSAGGATMHRVPTIPPSAIVDKPWDVIIADCEVCFSMLLESVDAPQLFNATRAVVLENDDQNLARQARTNMLLRDLGFRSTACVAHPWEGGSDPFRHGCFYALLTRGGPLQPTLQFTRRQKEATSPRTNTPARFKEDIHDLYYRVAQGVRSLPSM